MGFRFRKSINLGGFRVNLSKTGIGYSFGVPGLRFTQMANGRTRRTFSIPGTGLSYVDESKGDGSYSGDKQYNYDEHNQLEYSSSVETSEDTFNEFVQLMNKLRNRDRIFQFMLILTTVIALFSHPILFLFPICLLCIRLFCQNLFTVDNRYEFLSCADEWYAILNIMLYIISLNKKVSLIENQYSTTNYKYNSGANYLIDSKNATIRPQFLKYIKLEYAPYTIRIKNKIFYFLPNLILADDGHKYSWIDYKDLDCSVDTARFIEENVPSDATVVDHTWKYTNKEGGPDRRFNDNYQIAICQYCEVRCFNNKGFDITLQLSNINTLMNLTGLSNILKGSEYFENKDKLVIVNKIIQSIIEGTCCPICGEDNLDNNKICSKCGYQVCDYYTHRQNTTEGNSWGKVLIYVIVTIFAYIFIHNVSGAPNTNIPEQMSSNMGINTTQTTERFISKKVPAKFLADKQIPNSEFVYTLRWDLFNLYKFQQSTPTIRVRDFENIEGMYTMSDLIVGFVDKNQQYKIAENYCIKYNGSSREYPMLEKVACNNPKSITELPYEKCDWFTQKDNEGTYYDSYDIKSLWQEFKIKGISKIENEIIAEENTYKSEHYNIKDENESIEEVESNSDRNYYDSICDDCKNHPEKIEQNIKDGGDKEWWKRMCSDFCKEYQN